MADEPIAEPLDDQEEEEGGPVKSFLEHLEDLRWVLIKSGVAAGVAMLGCLLAGNYVVRVLEWPLTQAPSRHSTKTQTVRVLFGTNQLSVLQITTNDPLASLVGTNPFVRLELAPVLQGTNQVLAWRALDDPDRPAEKGLPIQIINLSPAGSFVVATKVAFYGGLVLAAPFIFYFLAHFIFPALKMREKKYIYRGLAFGGGLFITGVCFCYFILLPVALTASVQYAEWLGFTANQWRAEDYVGFVCKFMLGMGVGFELPVVVLTLVKIGVLNYRLLAAGRRYVIVVSAVLGAVLTTPEVITQILMAVPLYMLYEICVWITWYWERQDKKREAGESAGGAVSGT
ncbi:MAG: twin-arginine translocase subunit TatC [Verrucomicrobia bacterium]|nr:twin-arginine translocase subunit TatC [Verrucomicrobiota bacterium]